MATYQSHQTYIRDEFGFYVQSCWIADMKSYYGLTTCIAPTDLIVRKE